MWNHNLLLMSYIFYFCAIVLGGNFFLLPWVPVPVPYNILTHWSVARLVRMMKKTGDQKSRWTVPLKIHKRDASVEARGRVFNP